MEQLNKELGLLQGIGLLSTSLLGTGVFAVPAIVAQVAGLDGLWAWPLLLILIFPIALIFAQLGKNYPSAGGVAYFIERAFNTQFGRATGWTFLSVIPFGLPAALHILSGFWLSLFHLSQTTELIIQILALLLIWIVGFLGAAASGWIQSLIAISIIGLIGTICFASSPSVLTIEWTHLSQVSVMPMMKALSVMFWCFVGLEAFVHLTAEFKNPERDFPKALIIGLLVAGFIYWAATAAVLFILPNDTGLPTMSLPKIVDLLFGQKALVIFCIIGCFTCFAGINIYCQSFSRLIWSQAVQIKPNSYLGKLSRRHTPIHALNVVIIISIIALLVSNWFSLELDSLLEYANGVFVLIYLLAMVAAIKLLKGFWKVISILCTIICAGLLVIIGIKSFYAIGIFIVLVFVAKKLK